jgi:signal transduction histidine kinase
LRALSHGIAPPVLTDRGLHSALLALAGRCTVPVALDTDFRAPDGRFAAGVETTAYFSVAEALTNVAKHSGAAHCWVMVAEGPAGCRSGSRTTGWAGLTSRRGTG